MSVANYIGEFKMTATTGFLCGSIIACPHCVRIGIAENVLRVFYCLQIIEAPLNWGIWGVNGIMKVLTCGCK